MNTMNVALTNLGQYNEGKLKFTWVSLPNTVENIQQAFKEIEVAPHTRYEEYFFTDWENEIQGIGICEYMNIYRLNDKLTQIEQLIEEYDESHVLAVIEVHGYTDNIEEIIDNTYLIEGDSPEDLAYHFAEQGLIEIPDHLTYYFDYEKYGRDLSFDYDYTDFGYLSNY